MILELTRIEKSSDGVFGILRHDGKVLCLTLEDPENGNTPGVSCIPEGEYDCVRVYSKKHGSTFLVRDVPGRSEILFHTGNTILDTRGCILLGMGFGDIHGHRGIILSREAMRDFRDLLAAVQDFKIAVRSI